MPTTRPRYTVTDTGALQHMLDDAHRRWPDITNRRQLLLRLAQTGHDQIGAELAAARRADVREQQRQALARAAELVDVDAALADAAWR